MTDLTEQWKKGELDIGEVYYVKTERGVYKANGEYLNSASCIYGFDISYIIAPVPTYSEYLALESDSLAKKEAEEIIAELEAENAKLKEEVSRESYKVSEAYCLVEEIKDLLKECESSIQYYQETYGAMDLDTYTLLAKLKEALK